MTLARKSVDFDGTNILSLKLFLNQNQKRLIPSMYLITYLTKVLEWYCARPNSERFSLVESRVHDENPED